jgi:hypothetical protein
MLRSNQIQAPRLAIELESAISKSIMRILSEECQRAENSVHERVQKLLRPLPINTSGVVFTIKHSNMPPRLTFTKVNGDLEDIATDMPDVVERFIKSAG